ncbi:MAG: Aminodeoxychorismate lyase [Parcubacteria group bacterium GW2011_GWA2_47_7]|nr:MAG: Aminodeoxychorismate lyase [Parcubacteria group bacterium GW2011_GWA2_47_7]
MFITKLEQVGVHPAINTESQNTDRPPQKNRTLLFLVVSLILVLCATLVYAWRLTLPPATLVRSVIVEIEHGSNVRSIASVLEREGVIRSATLFTLLAVWSDAEKSLGSGVYIFKMPMNVFVVLEQVRLQDHGIERLKITIPEGTTLAQMSSLIAKKLPEFDSSAFATATEGREGYLFPDTYFFYANATSGPIVEALAQNFEERTRGLQDETRLTGRDWGEIIVMASLIEEEAVEDVDRKIVSGILWSRINIGMRLQVDAPFVYIMSKSSSEISLDDLKYDSPYNTYLYKGLPPAPISNPGLLAIDAAMHPTETKYLYYLSDKEGVMHYAKTFEEHKLNKAKYLY